MNSLMSRFFRSNLLLICVVSLYYVSLLELSNKSAGIFIKSIHPHYRIAAVTRTITMKIHSVKVLLFIHFYKHTPINIYFSPNSNLISLRGSVQVVCLM
jgi:hypothetical protein